MDDSTMIGHTCVEHMGLRGKQGGIGGVTHDYVFTAIGGICQ